MTGLSNLGVARRLLELGLAGYLGVVYLDSRDRQMVLMRDGMKVVPLRQCGLRTHERFTFYDQVHTTGMDIKQPASAIAMLTLGKDMTFRDLAQGAYRMRAIGRGQQIVMLAPPTVTPDAVVGSGVPAVNSGDF